MYLNSDKIFTLFEISKDDSDRRIDSFLKKLLPKTPNSLIYKSIRTGKIRINNKRIKPSTRTKTADKISIRNEICNHVATKNTCFKENTKDLTSNIFIKEKPSKFPLRILYNGHGVEIINKPYGIPTHGTEGSVMSLLKQRLTVEEYTVERSLTFTPSAIHQLDKITSGILIIAKTHKGARQWSLALKDRKIIKFYLGVFSGRLPFNNEAIVWKDNISYNEKYRRVVIDSNGAHSITRIWPIAHNLSSYSESTLALIQIVTGKKHQIRAQAAIHHYALIGDRKYGQDENTPPTLHAFVIRNDLYFPSLIIKAPIPKKTKNLICQRFGFDMTKKISKELGKHI